MAESPCPKGSGPGSKGLGSLTGDKSRRRILPHPHLDISPPCLSATAAHEAKRPRAGAREMDFPQGQVAPGTEKGGLFCQAQPRLQVQSGLGVLGPSFTKVHLWRDSWHPTTNPDMFSPSPQPAGQPGCPAIKWSQNSLPGLPL